MTKRQIQRAAKIYAYSIVAGGDPGLESEEENLVAEAAFLFAVDALDKMRVDTTYIGRLEDCISYVKNESKEKARSIK